MEQQKNFTLDKCTSAQTTNIWNETSGSFWDTLSDLAEGFVETIESLGSSIAHSAEEVLSTSSLEAESIVPNSSNTNESKKLRTINITVTNKIVRRAVTWSYPIDDGNLYEIPTYRLVVSGVNSQNIITTEYFEVFRFGVHRPNNKTNPKIVGLSEQQMYTISKWKPEYTVHSAESPEKGAWVVKGTYYIHDGPDDPLVESRDNFYLHDSYKGESHGCIETETELYYDLATLKKSGQLKVKLWVHYSSLDTPTNGNTLRNPRPWYHQSISTDSGLIDAPDGKFPDRSRL